MLHPRPSCTVPLRPQHTRCGLCLCRLGLGTSLSWLPAPSAFSSNVFPVYDPRVAGLDTSLRVSAASPSHCPFSRDTKVRVGGNGKKQQKTLWCLQSKFPFSSYRFCLLLTTIYLLSVRFDKLPLANGSSSRGCTQMCCAVFSHQQKCQAN